MSEQSSEEWEEIMGKDVMFLRSKGVDKKGDSASMNTIVVANIKGYLVSRTKTDIITGDNDSSKPFEILMNQSYKIGEGDAIPALELALRHSCVGEHLRVRCTAKFAYGGSGRVAIQSGCYQSAAIPPHTDLEYEVDVLSHIQENEINPALMLVVDNNNNSTLDNILPSTDESNHNNSSNNRQLQRLLALTELQQRKEAGNRWFTYQDYARAARAYSKATKIADTFFNGSTVEKNQAIVEGVKQSYENAADIAASEEGTEEIANSKANARLAAIAEAEAKKRQFDPADEVLLEIYVSCLNNMSACQLKLGEYSKAKDICIRVLEIQPTNLKALLRAAKAALSTHCFEECEACLRQLLLLAPPGSSAAVAGKVERQALRQAQEKYRQQCREMSFNMSNKLFPTTNNNNNSNSNKVTKKVTKHQVTLDHTNTNITSASESNDIIFTDIDNNNSVIDNITSNNTLDYRTTNKHTEHCITNVSNNSNRDMVQKIAISTPLLASSSSNEIKTPTTSTATATATVRGLVSQADSGLLLLLGTSLLVLAISVVIVIWAQNLTSSSSTSSG